MMIAIGTSFEALNSSDLAVLPVVMIKSELERMALRKYRSSAFDSASLFSADVPAAFIT